MTGLDLWTERLIGVMILGLVLSLGAAAFGHMIPDRAGQYLATQARMLDSLRPHLLPVVLAFALGLALLGETRIAALGALGAVLVLGALILDHRARVAPAAQGTDVTLLWFNVLQENTTPADRIAARIRDSGADVVVLAESLPVADLPVLLADTYPHHAGCSVPRDCGLLLLSKRPMQVLRLRDLPSGPERFARLRVKIEDRADLDLIAMHMVKPWFLGMSATERAAIDAALGGSRDVPVVVAGDFNAAPWSMRMRRLERLHGLKHPARSVPTWPHWAGRLGLPIDHVLVRGGAAIVSVAPWGDDLGSNHRGLLARIALPARD